MTLMKRKTKYQNFRKNTNGTLAALSTELGIKESKTKYKKINRNVLNLEQDVIIVRQLIEGFQKYLDIFNKIIK